MKKLFLLCALSIIFIAYSCTKEETNEYNLSENTETRSWNTSAPDEYGHFRDLARVLSVGVEENTNLRTLIKTEALLQFDGDYNVLLSIIKDREISHVEGPITVKSYLGTVYSVLNIPVKVIGDVEDLIQPPTR